MDICDGHIYVQSRMATEPFHRFNFLVAYLTVKDGMMGSVFVDQPLLLRFQYVCNILVQAYTIWAYNCEEKAYYLYFLAKKIFSKFSDFLTKNYIFFCFFFLNKIMIF